LLTEFFFHVWMFPRVHQHDAKSVVFHALRVGGGRWVTRIPV
jgi:hypothetical protein